MKYIFDLLTNLGWVKKKIRNLGDFPAFTTGGRPLLENVGTINYHVLLKNADIL